MKFTVLGNPKPLKRHRHSKFGTYDPSKKDKKDFYFQALKHKPSKPFSKNVFLNLNFHIKRPKSHYRTGKYSHLLKLNKCYHHSYHTQKPDLSNLIKFVEDALEGANGFFTDDCKIVDIIAKKFWVEGKVWENEKEANQEPRTEISLFEL